MQDEKIMINKSKDINIYFYIFFMNDIISGIICMIDL